MSEFDLYISGMSIPQVSKETGIPLSTLRFRFQKSGILRNRADAVRMAAKQGRLGSGVRGKKRIFTEKWKKNISKAKLKKDIGAGFSIKPSGYIEYTKGEFKGRLQHVVEMEKKIGRRLYSYECVHHRDGVKANNHIDNLELMTRSDHARHHALLNNKNRIRDKIGRYV